MMAMECGLTYSEAMTINLKIAHAIIVAKRMNEGAKVNKKTGKITWK